MKLLSNISKNVFFILTVVYAMLMCMYIYGRTAPRGDEFVFFYDIDFINANGWIKSIERNISIPYMLLSYPFTLLFNKLLALKLANLFLFIVMISYIYKRNKASLSFYFYLLFYLLTTIFFFLGINDSIFSFGLLLFFNETYLLLRKKKFNTAIAFSGLILAIFTRSLYVVYLPILLFSFYFIYTKRKEITFKLKIPLALFLFFIVLNVPSLLKNKTLSYDLKNPPAQFSVSWPQRQYLAQLMVNSGELKVGKHPSWEVTQEYVNKNGVDSLPYSLSDSILFDLKLTVVEFFKDFKSSLFYSFRQLGLIIFIPFLIFALGAYKKELNIRLLYVPFISIITLCIFSFIIISNVELRWLMPLYILLIIWFSDLEKDAELPKYYFLANYAIMSCLLLYGSFKVYHKLF